MARPRKDTPPDLFTSTEMAVAAGITARSFGVLVEADLAPKAANTDYGKQSARLWNSFGLGEAAVIGAIHACGVELMMSAKIAALVIYEFSAVRGTLPSRFSDYLQRPLNPTPGHYPWADADSTVEQHIEDDFWLHHLLRTKSDIYRSRTAMEGDLFVEIADRRYVFTDFSWSGKRRLPRITPWGITPAEQPDVLLEIEGWARGKDAVVKPIWEITGLFDGTQGSEEENRAKQIEYDWLKARQNAVGILSVNVSLAIRNAFDAIHDHRISTGASFDWAAPG